jgi:hypothetical protein
MKTNIITLTLLSLLSLNIMFAQDRTTVTANNSEISDNLDLRAVASIFGDSENLEDFERRLNNPKTQISNLDLNHDNQVDYLRVIETVEGNTHLIVIQSVLGRDLYQDIATVEVYKDRNNRVQVQVVGDVYMYGTNYIYEPVYAYTPVIYSSFWVTSYRPYCSSWYWNYYPSYYVAWHPFPIFRYRNNISVWINFSHNYNYVTTRNCYAVYNNYYRGRRGNAYEVQYPNRSFNNRHNNYSNRYELDRTRTIRTVSPRGEYAASNNGRNNSRNEYSANSTQTNNERNNTRTVTKDNGTRSYNNGNIQSVREYDSNNSQRDVSPSRSYAQNNSRSYEGIKTDSPRSHNTQNSVRTNNSQNSQIRSNSNRSENRSNSNSAGRNYSNSNTRNNDASGNRGNSSRTRGNNKR